MCTRFVRICTIRLRLRCRRARLQQELLAEQAQVADLLVQLSFATEKHQQRTREAKSLKTELERSLASASDAQQDYVSPLFRLAVSLHPRAPCSKPFVSPYTSQAHLFHLRLLPSLPPSTYSLSPCIPPRFLPSSSSLPPSFLLPLPPSALAPSLSPSLSPAFSPTLCSQPQRSCSEHCWLSLEVMGKIASFHLELLSCLSRQPFSGTEIHFQLLWLWRPS